MIPLYISEKLFSYLPEPLLDWFITIGADDGATGEFVLTDTGYLLYGSIGRGSKTLETIPEFSCSYLDSYGQYISYTNYTNLSFSKDPYTGKRDFSSLGKLILRFSQEKGVNPPAPHILGEWVTEYKSNIITEELDFDIVEGTDIAKYYHQNTYCEYNGEGSPLHNSCMKLEEFQPFLELYVKNRGICRMLICKNKEGKLFGRAIIWKTDRGILMDRIYYVKEYVKHLFLERARNEGWYYKMHQNSHDNFEVMGGPEKLHGKRMIFNVYLKAWDFKYYPHMDTLDYLDMDSGTLTNKVLPLSGNIRKIKTSTGKWEY